MSFIPSQMSAAQREEILTALSAVFSNLLGRPTVLKDDSNAASVEGWDSLSHIELLVAAEKHFGVVFTSEEIHGFANAGEIARAIESKLRE